MARLWIMQSDLEELESPPVTIIYDSTSAADVAFGKSVARSCHTLSQFTYSIHMYIELQGISLGGHHVHSHEVHPWNEYVYNICDYIITKPQQESFAMTPVSPIDGFKAYSIYLASVFCFVVC